MTVSVIGLRNECSEEKYIYTDDLQIAALNINGYLADASNVMAVRRPKPVSSALPPMSFGSKPTDGGHLILSPAERTNLLDVAPEAASFIKQYMGSAEFINGGERYCLWIDDESVDDANLIPAVHDRLNRVSHARLAEGASGISKKFSAEPHRFIQRAYKPTDSIIVPSISSGRRKYIPMGYLGPDTIISNKGFAVYDAEPWVFALLTSNFHMTWVNAVSGRMREDYQYSNTIVYNNFPVPPLSEKTKEKLTVAALRVLDVREYHCEQTLAELYDPDKMPQDLRDAHATIDALVDSIYSKKPYETDEQRLSDLFSMYEKMITEEAAKAPAKKVRRTAK